MRAVSNSLVALLIVAALFWGNCFSCPQLLLSLTAKAPHSCCKRSAPVKQTCTTRVLQHFVKADPVAMAAPAVAAVAAVVSIATPATPDLPVTPEAPHSPPLLLELISVLRV